MIKLLIDKRRLHDLFQQHQNDFMRNKFKDFIDVITAIGFLISIYSLSSSSLGIFYYVLGIIGVIFICWSVKELMRTLRKKYTLNTLEQDTVNLDETLHHFSIIAIKDTFNTGANRFLLYYDPRWKCEFFPNFKTADTEKQNEDNIKQYLFSEFIFRVKGRAE